MVACIEVEVEIVDLTIHLYQQDMAIAVGVSHDKKNLVLYAVVIESNLVVVAPDIVVLMEMLPAFAGSGDCSQAVLHSCPSGSY